jgi:transposase
MQVVNTRCCGLDVHQKTVVACVLLTQTSGQVARAVRVFGTMTVDLLALNEWLNGLGVRQVAMESTGVLWRPVYNLLEADHDVILVNAQHMKAATTDSPQWKHSGFDRHGRGDRSDPCVVRPAIAVA